MHTQKHNGAKKMNWWSTGAAGLAAVAMLALPAMAVEVSPTAITFDSNESSATLDITQDGQKVTASDIKSVRLYASGHDYDHMIEVVNDFGRVTVRPSNTLEIGTYDLVIDTTHGKATVNLQAPLDGLYTSLESRAKRLGITEDELKARLGLTQKVGDEYVDMNLPKVYFVGQTMRVPIARAESRSYAWSVNGQPVEIGLGESTFTYTFTEPGVYDFSYVESEDGRPVATGFGATSVVPEPPVRYHYEENTVTEFQAPEGYAHYVWTVDGQKQTAGATYSHTFDKPGMHTITVHAHTPIAGPEEAFRKVTFLVTVS